MRCAECSRLDLSTRLTRHWAAIGYAVCMDGCKPKDEGFPNLQQWPINIVHPCLFGEALTGQAKQERKEKLAFYRRFLEKKYGKR